LFMLAKRQGSKQDSFRPRPQFCFTRSFTDFSFYNCSFCWLGHKGRKYCTTITITNCRVV